MASRSAYTFTLFFCLFVFQIRILSYLDNLTSFFLPDDITTTSIIQHHNQVIPHLQNLKQFSGVTLAYVTPWNNHGYDTAKWFNSKLDYVSPVWYTVQKEGKGYSLQGTHDVDSGWIQNVRHRNITAKERSGATKSTTKIVPRFQLQLKSQDEYRELMKHDSIYITSICDLIVKECLAHSFDGVTLEVGSPSYLALLVANLGERLHREFKELLLVVPPQKPENPSSFPNELFKKLLPYVDYISLMTYDYTTNGYPGPNAPLEWCQHNVQSICQKEQCHRVLMGLNFYGYHFLNGKMEPVLGNQLVKWLEKEPAEIIWMEKEKEHMFLFHSPHPRKVFYPTLKSITERLQLAEQLQAGISIWEIGQGMDYFFNLL